ncbi:MAG: Obg family GTPase CgtA [Gammaproteobacteria bacterium]
MNFIDEVFIEVSAGKGGDGLLSFMRAKNIPKGGPDGGDGGKGGDIIFRTNEGLNTLAQFRYEKFFTSELGKRGGSNNKTGSNGDDLVIEVPPGTVIFNEVLGEKIVDLDKNNEEFLIAKGGEGGLGNLRFKSSKNRAPRQTTKGEEGDYLSLRLELRLLADVGLLGKPNSGKSSLVKSVSSANPKIADYAFTTLKPSLGVVDYLADKSFVISDIPGLIAGASEGVGLGIQFLKHLSRTRAILILIDIENKLPEEIKKEVEELKEELINFDEPLVERVKWLILNKLDLVSKEDLEFLKESLLDIKEDLTVHFISAKNRVGTEQLMKEVGFYLEKEDEED